MKTQIFKNITVSATGLRKVANALQKQRKTKKNVKANLYITGTNRDRTFGIKI